jgi:hypothetical protein
VHELEEIAVCWCNHAGNVPDNGGDKVAGLEGQPAFIYMQGDDA